MEEHDREVHYHVKDRIYDEPGWKHHLLISKEGHFSHAPKV